MTDDEIGAFIAKFPHYRKDIRHLSVIDPYRIFDLYGVTDPAAQHVIKKLLACGKRGAKDFKTDLMECGQSIHRRLHMMDEDGLGNEQ